MMLTMPDNLIELREKYHIKHVPFYKSCSLKALAIHMCLHSKHVGFVKEALAAVYNRCDNDLVKEYVLENLAEEAGKQSPDGAPEDHGNMITAFCRDQDIDEGEFNRIKDEWFTAGWWARGLHYRSVAERDNFDTVFAHFWIQESQLVEWNEEVLIPRLLECGYDRDDDTIRWFTSHGRNDVTHSQKWVELYHHYAGGYRSVNELHIHNDCKTGLQLRLDSPREVQGHLAKEKTWQEDH